MVICHSSWLLICSQEVMSPSSSESSGWRTIARRFITFLQEPSILPGDVGQPSSRHGTLHSLHVSSWGENVYILLEKHRFNIFVFVQITQQRGLSKEQSALLISLIGFFNTGGRIVSGAVTDHPKVDALFMTFLALSWGAVCPFLMTFCYDFWSYTIVCVMFGISLSAWPAVTSSMLVSPASLYYPQNIDTIPLLRSKCSSSPS